MPGEAASPLPEEEARSSLDLAVNPAPPNGEAPRWRPFAHTSVTLTIFLILLVLGPVAGIFAYRQAADIEREEAIGEFDERLLVQVAHVREELLAIVEALHSLRAFFDSSEVVTREEFAIFTSDMRARRPTILATEWIPLIPAGMRSEHEAAVRAEGIPGYAIRERTASGLGPAGSRDEYYPVTYVEPLRLNQRALGFDLGSEPVRRDVLRRATETGNVALSEPVALVQEEDPCLGVLAVLPIHDSRNFDPRGFALIVFRIEDLVRHSLLGGSRAAPAWMKIRLTAVSPDLPERVLFESEGCRDDCTTGLRSSAMDITVGGQLWRLHGHPDDKFLDGRRTSQPALLGLTVFLVWEAFFGMLFLLAKWSRDRSLQEKNRVDETVQRLSSALEQTADVVFITDRVGTIEYVNPSFERVFGYSRKEAMGGNPRILKSGKHGKDYYDSLWNTVRAGKVFRASTVNKKKNGELIHVEQTITPMLNPEGQMTHYVSVCKDMTERLKREEHETELHLAAVVQRRLYPSSAPRMKGFDIAGAVFSAEATCGDYFDYIPCKDGGMAVAIGDVSGHGLGPALIMAETRAYLRPLVHTHEELGSALGYLHRSISGDIESNRFVTLLVARFDPDATCMRYANAGHTPGYLMDRDGVVKAELNSTGPAIGILDDPDYATSPEMELEPGDLVLFLTDGVTESRALDGSFFDEEGALEVVRNHRHESAREIIRHLYEAARAFDREETQADDITIVVAKVDPA